MRPSLEVAQVIEQFLPQIPAQDLTVHHRRTLQTIRACRTAELGAHIDACDQCGHLRIGYNSCRNRHCPTCPCSVVEAFGADARTRLWQAGVPKSQ